jgi:hypothetical protein
VERPAPISFILRTCAFDAFGKETGYPYAMFVDVNLPPEAEGLFPPRYFIEVLDDLEGEIQAS